MDVAPGGYRYGGLLLAAGLAVALLEPLIASPPVHPLVTSLLVHPLVAAALVVLGIGAIWFHRDPERSVPDSGVLAPADGTVQVLREEASERLRVGVFMNLDDVHVNRAPLEGTVLDCEHVSGAHRPAFTKESDRNERVHLRLDTAAGPTTVTLVAGAFARRIHPYVEAGQSVDRGERIGHISFGSRVDVLLPPAIDRGDLAVERGDVVTAGESVLVTEPGVGAT